MTKLKCSLKVVKLNQYFGSKETFRIVDEGKKGADMWKIKKEFNSRKDANKFVKDKCKK